MLWYWGVGVRCWFTLVFVLVSALVLGVGCWWRWGNLISDNYVVRTWQCRIFVFRCWVLGFGDWVLVTMGEFDIGQLHCADVAVPRPYLCPLPYALCLMPNH